MCKISIITVTYNACKTLPITLNSIRNQNYKDYELILIDGGSKDGTQTIIDDNKDIISYCVSQKDKGIYDAMNKGIAVAKGVFCMFLNAGDAFYDSNSLSTMAESISTDTSYDMYFFDAYYEGSKGKRYFTPRLKEYPWRFCHQSMLFNSALIKKENYNIKYKLSGDSELVYRLLGLGHSYISINKPVVLEETGVGATHDNLIASCKELYSIPYLKAQMNPLKICYNMFKIYTYSFLNKIIRL